MELLIPTPAAGTPERDGRDYVWIIVRCIICVVCCYAAFLGLAHMRQPSNANSIENIHRTSRTISSPDDAAELIERWEEDYCYETLHNNTSASESEYESSEEWTTEAEPIYIRADGDDSEKTQTRKRKSSCEGAPRSHLVSKNHVRPDYYSHPRSLRVPSRKAEETKDKRNLQQ